VATNGTLAAGPGPVYLAGSGQVSSVQCQRQADAQRAQLYRDGHAGGEPGGRADQSSHALKAQIT
jgi:hypothetical protein